MNKPARVAAALLLATLPLYPAQAQSAQTDIAAPTAPAAQAVPGGFTTGGLAANPAERLLAPLAGVRQLTVTDPIFIDTRNAAECKLDAAKLRQGLMAALAAEGLPVAMDNAAATSTTDRLTLRPQIATLKDGVVNCVSWVSLAVEQQRVLATDTSAADRKALRTEYWSRGALMLTPVVDHATGVNDVLVRLARVLARQWRIDNPNAVPTQAPAGATAPAALQDLKR